MPKTILIVEDEEAVRELEKFILEQQGYDVMEARDGLEGLTKAEFRKPDLILLDLMMPDLGGEQVLTALGADEGLRDVPVIAVSADASRGTKVDMYRRGVAAYITKPFDSDALLGSVEQAISRRAG